MTISLEQYTRDPCGSLSIPWWKAQDFHLPPGIRVMHARDFDAALLAAYADDPYFRLRHC